MLTEPAARSRCWSSRSATGAATAGASPARTNTCGKRFDWQLGDLPARLRPQVHLLAHRLQPEGRPTCRPRSASRSSTSCRASSTARRRNFATPARGPAPTSRTFFVLPEATPGTRAELVRLPARRARRGAVRPQCRDRAPRGARRSRRGCCSPATCCASPPTGTSSTARRSRSPNTDFVMTNTFWIGVYPGLTPPMLDYVLEVLHEVAA